MSENPYSPPAAQIGATPPDLPEPAASDTPKGIGGWLILPLIGLCVTPIKIFGYLIGTFLPLFQDGSWTVLTTPGNADYHALWGPLILMEIVGNLVFAFGAVGLVCLMFMKSPRFPRLFIVYMLTNIAFLIADAVLGELIPEIADDEMTGLAEIVRTSIGAAIWIPYMLRSTRVRNTFARTR